MNKISIRIFNDKEVRALWDDASSKWWFSVVDVVAVLNEEDDYTKAGNYWRWLKRKLKKENHQLVSGTHGLKLGSTKERSQFVSATHRLKLTAKDGKKYFTDMLDSEGIAQLARVFPGTNAVKFLDWFTYSENSLDGQSKKKAYSLFESNLIDESEIGTAKGLQQIHAYLFGGLYDFAGQIRTHNISKGGFQFAMVRFLDETLQTIERMPEETFEHIAAKYIEMNVAHPFMEGNGRATRIWLDLMLKKNIRRCVDWSQIAKKDYFAGMIESVTDGSRITALLKDALTEKIHDREMFMKGIDYSYYYEEEDIVYHD